MREEKQELCREKEMYSQDENNGSIGQIQAKHRCTSMRKKIENEKFLKMQGQRKTLIS